MLFYTAIYVGNYLRNRIDSWLLVLAVLVYRIDVEQVGNCPHILAIALHSSPINTAVPAATSPWYQQIQG
jgi:hypothetical protein